MMRKDPKKVYEAVKNADTLSIRDMVMTQSNLIKFSVMDFTNDDGFLADVPSVRFDDPRRWVHAALIDKVVGSISTRCQTDWVWVYHLLVKPEYRKCRIATALVDQIVGYALSRKPSVKGICCGVAESNKVSQKFWESIGFEYVYQWSDADRTRLYSLPTYKMALLENTRKQFGLP